MDTQIHFYPSAHGRATANINCNQILDLHDLNLRNIVLPSAAFGGGQRWLVFWGHWPDFATPNWYQCKTGGSPLVGADAELLPAPPLASEPALEL